MPTSGVPGADPGEELVVVAGPVPEAPARSIEGDTRHEHEVDRGRLDLRAGRLPDPEARHRRIVVGNELDGDDPRRLDAGDQHPAPGGEHGIVHVRQVHLGSEGEVGHDGPGQRVARTDLGADP